MSDDANAPQEARGLATEPFPRALVVAGVAVVLLVVLAAAFALKPHAGIDVPSNDHTPRNDRLGSAFVNDVPAAGSASGSPAMAMYAPADDPLAFAASTAGVLDAASGAPEVNLFDAAGEARTLDAAEVPAVYAALDAFGEAGYEAGFVVFDLTTGRGIGCNADLPVFSASTVKAPFVAFVAQSVVDSGQASLDDEIVEDATVAGTGVMASDEETAYDLETVLYNTIVHSDNTGYALLRENFGESGFEEWVQSVGVDAESWEGTWYPYYSPRDLAKLWLDVGAYLAVGDGSSELCKSLLSQSGNSFLRQTLGDGRAVVSKPGFEIDEGAYAASTAALNDAGIVFDDAGAYVIAVMSTADYDDEYYTENQPLIENLIASLGDARDLLLARTNGVH